MSERLRPGSKSVKAVFTEFLIAQKKRYPDLKTVVVIDLKKVDQSKEEERKEEK